MELSGRNTKRNLGMEAGTHLMGSLSGMPQTTKTCSQGINSASPCMLRTWNPAQMRYRVHLDGGNRPLARAGRSGDRVSLIGRGVSTSTAVHYRLRGGLREGVHPRLG